ncbi:MULTISPECIES: hypothetical protein [unclassified Thioalkalivibrio]|uniref:hypothetical protein n=1 Tax=unclassified Thioalkalivibrio TaxID=2621013 RepID=UPI0012DD5AB0|nr:MULTISPECIES: hypothetical protein [unclassified Thioalkalivibrio]
MAIDDTQDIDSASVGNEDGPTTRKKKTLRRSLSAARRELSDDELGSSAVQKLLIDEVERLEEENQDLDYYREQFHDADKKASIFEERHRRVLSQEIISNGCLVVGAAALGYVPSLSKDFTTAAIVAVFGGILVVAGIWAKVVRL